MDRVLLGVIWVPWVPIFLSTLSLSCSRGKKKKKGKKDTEFFFLTSLEKKRYPSFSTLPTISIGRVFVKGIRENVRDIVLFRFRCSRL